MRASQTNGRSGRPQPDVEERYRVVPASFVVFDKHTGQTIHVYHGEDTEVHAQRHARQLHALKRRVADQNVVWREQLNAAWPHRLAAARARQRAARATFASAPRRR